MNAITGRARRAVAQLLDGGPLGAESRWLLRWLAVFLLGKILVFVASLPLPFGGVHSWRQSDTIGVALRYWLKWSQEPWRPELLLPAVLNRGDGNGIMAMEFPLLGLSLAPAFSLGPLWGTGLARLALMALGLGVLWQAARAWRQQTIAGVSGPLIVLLLPVVSLSSVYTFKFMPDALSLGLFIWGLGLVWNLGDAGQGSAGPNSAHRSWLGMVLLALGLLLKPTTIIAAGVILLGDGRWGAFGAELNGRRLRAVLRRASYLVLPLMIAVLYYTAGLKFIASFADSPGLFKVGLQSVAANLASVAAGARELPDLLISKLLFAPGLVLLALGAFLLNLGGKDAAGKEQETGNQLAGWLVLGLQIVAIFAIDGDHAFIHEYYFIGCAPVLVWLLVVNTRGVISRWPQYRRRVLVGLLLLAAASALDKAYFSLRGYTEPFRSRFALAADCAALKATTPELPWHQAYSFRSHPHPYPILGLCFHEREGHSTARYGLYHSGQPAPAGCRTVAARGNVLVADCQ